MAAALKLYLDWLNQKLVLGPNSSTAFQLKTFYASDILPLQIQMLEPVPGGSVNEYARPDISNISLQVAIADAPGASPTILAGPGTWTKDISNAIFTGSLALNTAAMSTFMTGVTTATKAAWIQFKAAEGANSWTVFEGTIQIAQPLITTAFSAPAPGLTPLSLEDAVQRFVQFRASAGQTITLTSPDGNYQRIIGCRNDNQPQDDVTHS